MLHTQSHAIFSRAQQLMPGGVNSPARAFGGVGGEPVVFERAAGAYLFDVDGNRYIDYVGAWGPMILGHQHPAVVEAVKKAAEKGFSFGAPTRAENELAELISACVPSIEMVRLVSSGTEATMSAIRLARGFTGRDVIIKFAGNYHGHVDSLLVAAGSSAATLGVPNSPGVTAGTTKDTLILQYNDVPGLEGAFVQHGSRIAGVIFEPVVGNMGVVVPSREFLKSLRNLTRQHGAVLICDEVMTGFRVALGGAQERLNIQPDITTLGKIVGGGLPIGGYGGRRDIMQHVLPAGKVFQAGTNSGNPIATAAGIATLQELRKNPPYEKLEQLGARLADGLLDAAKSAGVPHSLSRVGSMLTLFFAAEAPHDWPTAAKSDTARFAKYFWGLLEQGVYMPCSQFEAFFVSAAHTEADIDATIAAARGDFSMNAPPANTAVVVSPPQIRLGSIDAYRGFVMLLMMAEVLHLSAVARAWPQISWRKPLWEFLALHQSHVEWTGCTLHDLIQPSFSFLVGVALPYSLANRVSRGQSLGWATLHAAWRSLLLVALGIFLRSTHSDQTRFTFEDTLSQIGLGYLPLFLLGLTKQRWQWIALVVILVGYWGAFALYPLPGPDFAYDKVGVPADWLHLYPLDTFQAHWNKNSNLAWAFDTWFLNLFHPAKPFTHNGGGYATLSFIPTLGTMILGLLAGGWLQKEQPARTKLVTLSVAGLACLILGFGLDYYGICPSVKRIWTPAWTLYSGGWCFLFMAAFYGVIDVQNLRTWAFPLTVIGMNSIAAYVIAHLFEDFLKKSLHTHLGENTFQILGPELEPLLLGLAILLIFWLILFWMYRRKVFLRI